MASSNSDHGHRSFRPLAGNGLGKPYIPIRESIVIINGFRPLAGNGLGKARLSDSKHDEFMRVSVPLRGMG